MKSIRPKPLTSGRKAHIRSRGIKYMPKETVQVYCRLRPMQFSTDIACMKVVSSTAIVITPPESATNFRNNNHKGIQTTFSRVFTHDATQKEVFNIVALPLIDNLVHGKNSLLFTYGVTGSGKTYTMTGDSENVGIMQQCLQVLFNSITSYQTREYIFKPDKLNGFEIQSEVDAMLDRQNNMHAAIISQKGGKSNKHQKADSGSDGNHLYIHDYNENETVLVDPDYAYAVFVSYVEIYNNSVYDLLDEDDVRAKTLQSKIVREDGNKNMYVHSVTEIEVKSANEAFEVFSQGQRRRRVAHTALNAESSRSHSVFTIRLVQAPLDFEGKQVIQDKRVICISQLSLVDLAGSERTNRTKNTGQRLREAGNINNSLMTLRSCMEILKENQTQGTNKIVPYRDSKLTHLFKNYFDGEGQVRMIVCVNPRADDYDETNQVMKFAEVTQEVQVTQPTIIKPDLGFTPGRRQPHKTFKETQCKLEKELSEETDKFGDQFNLVYSLGGPFPEFEMINPHNDHAITSLMHFLEQRINKRRVVNSNLQEKQDDLRRMLMSMEQVKMSLQVENASLKAAVTQQKKKVSALEGHVCKTEAQIDSLLRKLNTANCALKSLQQELKDRDLALNQRLIDKQRVKQKYNFKMQAETDKMNRELEVKLRQQREQLQNQMKHKEDKLRLVKQILIDNDVPKTETLSTFTYTGEPSTKPPGLSENRSRKGKMTISNPRYRRSQSADRWVDHRPEPLVPLGTILQPLLRRKRNITHLTDPKEITDGASKYCLTAQEQDTDGELETKLFKADILPTTSGGAQVVFNDMECLQQVSPKARKRSNSFDIKEIAHINVTNHSSISIETSNKRLRVLN